MSKELSLGMCIHRWGRSFMAYTREDLSKNLDSCKELGVEFVRYNNSCPEDDDINNASIVAEEVHKRGMKLMLVMDTPTWINSKDSCGLEDIEEYYEKWFYKVASKLKGKVEIYQLFNEMDVACMRGSQDNIILPAKDGRQKGEYDSDRWDRAILAVKGALKGVKRGDPSAVTCINFAWWHTALIYEMYRCGCDFDIIGLDWYSDCEEVSSIQKLIADVKENIPGKDMVICETNFWMHPMSRDPIEKQNALKVKEIRYKNQAEWVPEFIQKMIDLHEPKLKCLFFYELLDEPFFEKQMGKYYGESHFGFIECDENGKNQVRKPAFYTLKSKIEEISK